PRHHDPRRAEEGHALRGVSDGDDVLRGHARPGKRQHAGRRVQGTDVEPDPQRTHGGRRDCRGEPRAGARLHPRHRAVGVPVKIRSVIAAVGVVLCVSSAAVVSAQTPVTKATVPGIANFSRVETTVACAGATSPAALADVKKMGFNSVINLRMAGEAGFELEAEAAAAKAAGINYFHLPFNNAAPDPAVVDSFLKVITDKANEPAFIHCASANRA